MYDAICLEEERVDGELEEILEKNSKIQGELENIQKLPYVFLYNIVYYLF